MDRAPRYPPRVFGHRMRCGVCAVIDADNAMRELFHNQPIPAARQDTMGEHAARVALGLPHQRVVARGDAHSCAWGSAASELPSSLGQISSGSTVWYSPVAAVGGVGGRVAVHSATRDIRSSLLTGVF